MSRLAKSRDDTDRQIWELLTAYANTQGGTGNGEFARLVNFGLDWIGGDESDLEACHDTQKMGLEALADQYRPEVVRVMTWLSDPAKQRAESGHAAEFLRKFGTAIVMHIDGNNSFKGDDDPLVFEWPGQIRSVISPVCKFILDQIERHDIQGEPLRDVIPFGKCERQGCNRFFVIERVGRARFCSNVCRATVHQSGMTKEERAERMRNYRKNLKDRAAAKLKTKRGTK